jgi:hypothetical protein
MNRTDTPRSTDGRPAPARFAAFGRMWQSVRPRTRRGTLLAVVAIGGGSVLLAVVFLVGAAMAWSPYVESDLHPDANPRMWAALQPTYAGVGQCAQCHRVETARAASARHAGIGCESCHGPTLEHALAGQGVATPTLPTEAVCTRCHEAALGRPAGLLQIDTSDHYVPMCLQCHDPHTGISTRPPVVLHPLDNLPACVTCHGPEGFKARSQRHPEVTGDEPCLACHAPGRGPEPAS